MKDDDVDFHMLEFGKSTQLEPPAPVSLFCISTISPHAIKKVARNTWSHQVKCVVSGVGVLGVTRDANLRENAALDLKLVEPTQEDIWQSISIKVSSVLMCQGMGEDMLGCPVGSVCLEIFLIASTPAPPDWELFFPRLLLGISTGEYKVITSLLLV